ncbi:MAG: type II secretion system protein GspG [Candidatus Chromulinivorax sp.]|nr:type II secretion system protein GspG [Candidatus Chromulinivorax sp.]
MAHVNKSVQSGFSVIELLISLGIIMLIMSFVVPGLAKLGSKSKRASTINMLKIINGAIREYKMDVQGPLNNLEDLNKKPVEGANGWNGPYLPDMKEFVDAWGQEIMYKRNERGAAKPYELYSLGDPEKEEEKIEAN